MISKIKITSKRQITIPKALREKINVKEGMCMSAYIQDKNLILKPLHQDSNKINLNQIFYQACLFLHNLTSPGFPNNLYNHNQQALFQ